MSGPGIVTLASLRIQAQERSDQLNSSFLSVSEWNRNVMGSYKELYDLLIAAYGCDYYATVPLQFTTTGQTEFYPLPDGTTTFVNGVTGATFVPPAFYKLLGLDLNLSPGQNQSYVTIWGFTFADRNRFAVPNFQSFYGVTNLRVRLHGNNLWLTPIPAAGQVLQLWQIPRPADLQPEFICGTTSSSTTVTCTDTSNLVSGMQIQVASNVTAFPLGTTISSITPNVSFVASNPATATLSTSLIRAWNDGVTVDGVSGWEEYIVLDAAVKALGKEESDIAIAMDKKRLDMHQRLIDMAENRNAGMPATVVDKSYSDYVFPTGNGSGWGY